MSEPGHGPRADGPARGQRPRLGRWLVLGLAIALAWPFRAESSTSVVLPALSPYLAVCAAVAVRSAGWLSLLALPLTMLAWVYPRWFCRHACPAGCLQETVARLRPSPDARPSRFPRIGGWLVLFTLGGALLGYPLGLWLDPLAVFSAGVNAWHPPLSVTSLLGGFGLPLLLLVSLAWPRLWCQRVCPLGAVQDGLRKLRHWPHCPAPHERETGESTPLARGRRRFLAAGAGAAGAFVIGKVPGRASPPLRPPGALDEPRFTGVCVRCGNCARACPSRIIQPDLGSSGIAGFLTPRLCFDADYCRENCHRCLEACPSGAIPRLSLTAKRHRIIGPAVVDPAICLLANGRECVACIKQCPFQAIAMQSSDGGFSNQPRVDLSRCTGCGACEAVCPVRPRRAIVIIPKPGILRG